MVPEIRPKQERIVEERLGSDQDEILTKVQAEAIVRRFLRSAAEKNLIAWDHEDVRKHLNHFLHENTIEGDENKGEVDSVYTNRRQLLEQLGAALKAHPEAEVTKAKLLLLHEFNEECPMKTKSGKNIMNLPF